MEVGLQTRLGIVLAFLGAAFHREVWSSLMGCLGMLQGLFFRCVLEEYFDAISGVRLGMDL